MDTHRMGTARAFSLPPTFSKTPFMATHLDLEEQEQLDQLKAFWKRYGNLISWLLIVVLGVVAVWNGRSWYQHNQAIKASAMFEELDRAAASGDVQRVVTAFNDIKTRYPKVAFTQQAGLLAAKVQFDKGQLDEAASSLTWVGENARELEYRTLARLRLAAILLEQKKFDEALQQLDKAASGASPEFSALVADRRGDVLMAQDKKDEAIAAYRKAWDSMDVKVEYRRLIEAKLTALAAAPEPAKAASGVKP
jgi:predicted negative regulator of RcsB-dependent stress response